MCPTYNIATFGYTCTMLLSHSTMPKNAEKTLRPQCLGYPMPISKFGHDFTSGRRIALRTPCKQRRRLKQVYYQCPRSCPGILCQWLKLTIKLPASRPPQVTGGNHLKSSLLRSWRLESFLALSHWLKILSILLKSKEVLKTHHMHPGRWSQDSWWGPA